MTIGDRRRLQKAAPHSKLPVFAGMFGRSVEYLRRVVYEDARPGMPLAFWLSAKAGDVSVEAIADRPARRAIKRTAVLKSYR